MLRGDTECRLQLTDEFNDAELVWTFTTDSRAEFIKKATQMWDWFMNDSPYVADELNTGNVVSITKNEPKNEAEDRE